MHQQFKIHHPYLTYNQLLKFTFSMDDKLPPVEKEVWKVHAMVDKARYLQELADYVPPPGYDSVGHAIPRWL
jgi:hypothetical protein